MHSILHQVLLPLQPSNSCFWEDQANDDGDSFSSFLRLFKINAFTLSFEHSEHHSSSPDELCIQCSSFCSLKQTDSGKYSTQQHKLYAEKQLVATIFLICYSLYVIITIYTAVIIYASEKDQQTMNQLSWHSNHLSLLFALLHRSQAPLAFSYLCTQRLHHYITLNSKQLVWYRAKRVFLNPADVCECSLFTIHSLRL